MKIHPVYAEMERTVFDLMSGLAREHGAINLGQGFPDAPGPEPVLEAAARALREKSNQYPPGAGLPELREAVCAYYARRQNLAIAPEQVTVTSGATEAIACAVLALVQPGDEVILFQPAYDAYAPMVRRAGGVPVSVMLAPPHFAYGEEALRRAITPRTRVLMLNDPLNPAGTVASEAQLAMIARLCTAHDLTAICDEVWEDVRFDGTPHRSLTTFEGMAARAVKIGSAGKIFGITGWKIGWMIAQGELATAVSRAHQFITYASAPPLQWAVAEGLTMPDAMLADQRATWAASRARLKAGLEAAGFAVLPNAATWFLCADLAASGIALTDREFSERAVTEAGVATVPVSALYEGEGRPEHIVRFCFTKPDAVLDEAVARLGKWWGLR
ncbi:aminotransferase [Novosphingobium mangrovi (ex Huang et al. 2023)]|uniref:Aminotransferase n=1 Tax=Novosphingobium mangrovi (ex Huang et al. 2023) TaxID=2976432 RepID=A0ABT2IA45_9SPHN|nr:aminotransferase [Novosphingobium mangrovi (ex Huang et al. 2023)]MCT2401673.1 aminotransferase [Novosphingobium mangrovi (ex Huang et al. 2023)]